MEWSLCNDAYDYRMEIQSSGYADMLHDNDRNIKYYKSMESVFRKLRHLNQEIHVLDIGCGTGLLSMMALKLGADSVTACESFKPMYHCANEILKLNGFLTNKITILFANSTELVVGKDMKQKANVLVSEIFDSELIGEGVLPVFEHARNNLLTKDAKIIPCKAKVFIQVLESEFLKNHNRLSLKDANFENAVLECTGYSSIFDVQLSPLIKGDRVRLLSSPTVMDEIDFQTGSADSNGTVVHRDKSVEIEASGSADAYAMWWQLEMMEEDEEVICTAPEWVDPERYVWRDHWLQGVLYAGSSSKMVQRGQRVGLVLSRDKYSYWLNYEEENQETRTMKPMCSCGLHSRVPRHRLAELNSDQYRVQTTQLVRLALASVPGLAFERSAVQLLSDPPSLLASLLPCLDQSSNLNRATASALLLEPYVAAALQPWDAVCLWYAADEAQMPLVGPVKLRLAAVLVRFSHLQLVHQPLRSVLHFDMTPFDSLLEAAATDNKDFPDGGLVFDSRSLWEYDGIACSQPVSVFCIDLRQSASAVLATLESPIISRRQLLLPRGLRDPTQETPNALVIWSQWELSDGCLLDNSLHRVHPVSGRLHWLPFAKQAVHFLPHDLDPTVAPLDNGLTLLTQLDVATGDFTFSLHRDLAI